MKSLKKIFLFFILFSIGSLAAQMQVCFGDMVVAKSKAEAACNAFCKDFCECEVANYCVSLSDGSCDALCTPNSNCIPCYKPIICNCNAKILNVSPFVFSACKQEPKCYNRIICDENNCTEKSDVWVYDSCNGWLNEKEDCNRLSKTTECGEWKCVAQGKTKTQKIKYGTKVEGYCNVGKCNSRIINTRCDIYDCPYGCSEIQGIGNCNPKAVIKTIPFISGRNVEISVGQSVIFDCSESHDPEATDIICKWDFGDFGSAAGTTVTKSFMKEGSYIVKLVVSDAAGLTDSTEILLNVVSKNWPPNACFDIMPEEGIVGVTEFIFDASCSSDPDIGLGDYVAKYEWDFGDGSIANGKKVKHTYTKKPIPEEVTFNVKLTVKDSGLGSTPMSSMQVKSVTVKNTPPSAKFIVEPVEGKAPLRISLYVEEPEKDGHFATYEWDFGNGIKKDGKNAAHTYNDVGTYTVKLRATDEYGASSESSRTIYVYSFKGITALGVENVTQGENTTIFVDCSGTRTVDIIVRKGHQATTIQNITCGTHTSYGPLTEIGEYEVIASLKNCGGAECTKSASFSVLEAKILKSSTAPEINFALVLIVSLIVLTLVRRSKKLSS
ncbi:MAG: PKD domain-containing protein [Candidatus Diapherotrites archaeon]|nr:PKD domain-containing protein [Candidatus Diapherotrites archaeon]